MEGKDFKKIELDKEIAKAKALLEEYDNSNEGQSDSLEDLLNKFSNKLKTFSNKEKDLTTAEEFKEEMDERLNLMTNLLSKRVEKQLLTEDNPEIKNIQDLAHFIVENPEEEASKKLTSMMFKSMDGLLPHFDKKNNPK